MTDKEQPSTTNGHTGNQATTQGTGHNTPGASPTSPQEGGGGVDRMDLALNWMMTRLGMLKDFLDPRRDLEKECGYLTEPISAEKYQEVFERNSTAQRVVEFMPMEGWKVCPNVYEDEDADVETQFEKDWKNVSKSLNGGSRFNQEYGNRIYEYMKRLNVLSGVGRYGIMLIGIDDKKDLGEPAEPKEGRKLLYLRVFPESLARIVRTETDPNNPRFGQPVMYSVTLIDPKTTQDSGIGSPINTATKNVHWSRVIHAARNLGSNEVLGDPELHSVIDHCMDLRKLYGASAEGYWKSCFAALSLETNPALGGNVDVNKEEVKGMMQDFQHGLQRYLTLRGLQAKTLAPSVVDPTPHIDAHIRAICIKKAVPHRIFMGSERGELSSEQDSGEWDDRLTSYRWDYLTNHIVVPVVDRLIDLGVLSEPEDGFHVWWPPESKLDPDKTADIAQKLATAMVAYVVNGLESLMTPLDFLTLVMGLDDEAARTVMDNLADSLEEEPEQPSPLWSSAVGLTALTELFKLVQAGGMSEEQLKAVIMAFYRVDEETADEIIADGFPETEPQPVVPVKVKGDERLVSPEDGTELAPATNPGPTKEEQLLNYDPKQPRVPKGKPTGGEWMKSGGSGAGGGGGGGDKSPSVGPVKTEWDAHINTPGSGNGVISDKHGVQYQVHHEVRTNNEGEHKHVYTVGKMGGIPGVDSVGGAETGWNKNRIMSVKVHEEYQKRGIATALYHHIEAHLQTRLHENPYTTPSGEALWRSRARAGHGVPTQ